MMVMRRNSVILVACLAIIGLLQACTTEESGGFSSFGDTVSGLQQPSDVAYYSDDEVLVAAKNLFKEGNYGRSQNAYQRAVEVLPNDAEAWLGLAASYDRVRRFDMADRAYKQAAKYIGNRPEYHNNVGYSHLLRGNLVQARRHFLKAYELDPSNPTIANNLELLNDSVRNPQRSASVYTNRG